MLFKKIYAWLLPFTCLLCGTLSDRNQDLCQSCYQDLPLAKHSCLKCAIPISTIGICGQCLQKTPPLDKTYALFLYQNPITKLILELKFNQAIVNARVLGELLTEKIQTTWYKINPLPDVIIPIPLHASRLKERGFNQALEIARPIAKALKLPLSIHSCIRVKPTAAQATLHAAERQQNMKHAFSIKEDFSNQHIAVIDDVITTGSTINEFCAALKQNGAKSIDVWCCARPQNKMY